jgi:cytochrome bd ubiquinol oxidase subunit I
MRPAPLAFALAPVKQAYLLQARQMQALSFSVHIPLVCFGIALPAIILYTEWRYLRTGDQLYRVLAQRWTRIMAALFAVGVITGTILSFEMGLLWPNFTATFGSVFGLGFAVEGFSFFIEAIFIGIFWHELVHMYLAGYIVTGFLLAGAYAIGRLRGKWTRYERTALAIPLTIAALVSPVQILVGDWAAREVAKTQPLKLAAIEGLAHTTKGAPEHLLGWYSDGQVKYGIAIPKMLSLLAFHNPNATVIGLDSVPADERPPDVNVVRVAFQTMVGIGTLLALLAAGYLTILYRRKRLPESVWFYRALAFAGPLSVVALIAGWVTTEVGRQPWVVYGVMRTSQAVTGASGIPIGYGALALIYVGVGFAVVWILRRLAKIPLELPKDSPAGG